MPTFVCRVSDKSGKVFELTRSADTADHLLRDLSSEGLYPLDVSEPEQAVSGVVRVRRAALLEFSEVLALLLASQLSVKDAVRIAEESLERGGSRRMAARIGAALSKGRRFSEVLDEYGRSIPPLYTGLVRIGERVGSLDKVMSQLVHYLKNQKELRDKVGTALLYPSLILVLAIVGMTLISIFVIPMLSETFSQFSGGAAATLAVASERISRLSTSFWVTALVMFVGSLVLVAVRIASGAARLMLDRLILGLPILGGLVRRIVSSHFVFAMETLTESGVSVEDALAEAAGVLGNEAYAAALVRVRDRVGSGATLGTAMRAESQIPKRIRSWVTIGEHTGSLSEVFRQMRGFYQSEVERAMGRLTALVEPVLIVLIGAAMLLVILRIIVPVFTAIRTIG